MNFPATPSDVFNFPSNFKGDVQIFHANNDWFTSYQQWIKPRGTSMSYFFLVGGGGGGGGGHQKPQNTNGGGGGGGGSACISRLLIPSFLLPNTLYVKVGRGGLGGPVSAAGFSGVPSIVATSPQSLPQIFGSNVGPLIVSDSGGNGGGGGGGGLVGNAGAGGIAGSPSSNVVPALTGLYSAVAGQAGGAGGAQTGAVGTSITAWSIRPVSSGAGGAGIQANASLFDFGGGSITAVSAFNFPKMNFPTDVGAVARGGDALAPKNGDSGVNFFDGPFLQSGGAGGASSFAGVAGNGGKGGIGCGGGGGGAGVTGGRGGDGGNGMVAIFSW
jgi:hypothetical protein